MKRTPLAYLTAFLVLIACTKAPQAPEAQTAEAGAVPAAVGDSVAIELSASELSWVGTKVTGKHEGSVNIKEGHLRLLGDSLVGGRVVIDMTSIADHDLSEPLKTKLESHLKSADFFDAAAHPTATFIITSTTKAAPTDSGSHVVTGNLTLRGVTKQIRFPATIKPTSTADNRLEATARFNLNRKAFGVAYEGKQDDLIRDEINLTFNLVTMGRKATAQ